MLQYDFDESVGYWVGMTAHVMRRALDAQLAKERITLRQWEVLAWIAIEGELSQADLAERLGIEAPTLAGILARMERDGWLERHSCPNDRRKKRIRATPQADAVWNRMVECCRAVREQAIVGLSAEELRTLKRVCEQIRHNLANGPAPVGDEDVAAECNVADKPAVAAQQTAGSPIARQPAAPRT